MNDDFRARRLMERRLETGLPEEADLFEELGGRDLQLDEVLDRARGIRRGRRRTTGLVAAAAVVALVAPAGVIIAGHDDASGPTPLAHPTAPASTSPGPTPTADPESVHAISIVGLDGRPLGAAPATGYVAQGVWHGPDGSTWTVPHAPHGVTDVVRVGNDVLVGTADADANRAAVLMRRDGRVVQSWPLSNGFATSPDGQVAFVRPDGTPVVIDADAGGWVLLDRVPHGSGFGATALLGGPCTVDPQGTGCTVVVNSMGVHPESWLIGSNRSAEPVRSQLRSIADVAPDGTRAGVVSYRSDLGTCSEVRTADDGLAWRTCDNRFVAFSPDGSRLLATGPVGDGLGDTVLDVLDARSGAAVVRYRAARDAAITRTVWEDDSHVLAVVTEQGLWAVLRVGLDGHVEVAVPPVKGNDPESPFVLPAR